MKGNTKIYHICNLSPKVIFRKEEDFLMAINRLACCAFATSSEVLAYAILSTHFHLIVMTDDIDRFIGLFSRNITSWYNRSYNTTIKLNISKRLLLNQYEVITAVNYALKNSVHHNITQIAFKYPYSSINCYFNSELNREEYFKGENNTFSYLSPSQLTSIEHKHLFGSHKVPDSFQIIGRRLVVPESFVNIHYVETIYSTSKKFLYNMTKPLVEEIEMFGGDVESRNKRLTLIDMTCKLKDVEVCGIIDKYSFPRTHTQLMEVEKSELMEKLRKIGVDKMQFERCS